MAMFANKRTSSSISVLFFALAVIMMMLCPTSKGEAVYHVRGYDGIPDSDYDSFGSGFAPEHRSIGDKVRFIYEGCPMLRVTREDFFNCDPTNPITRLVGNIFQFEEFGDFYFICESAVHCDENGLRDHIRVGYYELPAIPSAAPTPSRASLTTPVPSPSSYQTIAPSQAILRPPVPSPSSYQTISPSQERLSAPVPSHSSHQA